MATCLNTVISTDGFLVSSFSFIGELGFVRCGVDESNLSPASYAGSMFIPVFVVFLVFSSDESCKKANKLNGLDQVMQ